MHPDYLDEKSTDARRKTGSHLGSLESPCAMTDSVHSPEDHGIASNHSDVGPRPVRPTLGGHMRLDTDKAVTDKGSRSHSDEMSSAGLVSSQPPALLYAQDSVVTDVSPKAERLPSFRHISKIADAASEEASRPNNYAPVPPPPPVYPPPPVATQSPVLPQQPYPTNLQINPAAFGYGQQTSPADAYNGFYYPNPTSPTSSFGSNSYHARRQSHPHLYTTVVPQPPPLVTVSTNSSSGESYGRHSSMGDAVSTAQTTPLEASSIPAELAGRPPPPILPAPQPQSQNHMDQSNPGRWVCEHPGCSAAAFPSQYLLK